MPESKVRKTAATKKKVERKAETAKTRVAKQRRVATPGSRRWVPVAFITLGLLGVAWLILYYLAGIAVSNDPTGTNEFFKFVTYTLGGWNILIGLGLMAASFGVATLWK